MSYSPPTQPLDYYECHSLGEACADLHGAAYVMADRLRKLGAQTSTIQTLVSDITRHAVHAEPLKTARKS